LVGGHLIRGHLIDGHLVGGHLGGGHLGSGHRGAGPLGCGMVSHWRAGHLGGHRGAGWGRSGCSVKAMRRRDVGRCQGGIGEVRSRFGGGAKPWWAGHPPHGTGEWESNHGSAVGSRRKGNPEGRDVTGGKVETVKAVSNVHLAHVDRAMEGIGGDDALEDALEGTSKLHCLVRCQEDSFGVELVVRVVHDGAGLTVMLLDAADRCNSEAGDVCDGRVRKDHRLCATMLAISSVRKAECSRADLWGPRRMAASLRARDQGAVWSLQGTPARWRCLRRRAAL
jgi:hypothetical protein